MREGPGWLKRKNILFTVVAVAAIEFALIAPILLGWAEFDRRIGLVVFATIPAFALTIIQLVRTQQVQRAAYVKDFLMEFRKNGDLFAAYYDLVYRFRDDIYEKIDAAATVYKHTHPDVTADKKPVFDCFDELQTSREPGSRYFHPSLFQFSPEEKKLDGLLDYFNAVGLYVYEGLVRIDDVVTVLGDYLAVIADRKVIRAYLKLCSDPKQWKYDDTVGASLPFQHLQYLLESYREYNLHEYNRRRARELKSAIEAKEREVAEMRDKLRHQP